MGHFVRMKAIKESFRIISLIQVIWFQGSISQNKFLNLPLQTLSSLPVSPSYLMNIMEAKEIKNTFSPSPDRTLNVVALFKKCVQQTLRSL